MSRGGTTFASLHAISMEKRVHVTSHCLPLSSTMLAFRHVLTPNQISLKTRELRSASGVRLNAPSSVSGPCARPNYSILESSTASCMYLIAWGQKQACSEISTLTMVVGSRHQFSVCGACMKGDIGSIAMQLASQPKAFLCAHETAMEPR